MTDLPAKPTSVSFLNNFQITMFFYPKTEGN